MLMTSSFRKQVLLLCTAECILRESGATPHSCRDNLLMILRIPTTEVEGKRHAFLSWNNCRTASKTKEVVTQDMDETKWEGSQIYETEKGRNEEGFYSLTVHEHLAW